MLTFQAVGALFTGFAGRHFSSTLVAEMAPPLKAHQLDLFKSRRARPRSSNVLVPKPSISTQSSSMSNEASPAEDAEAAKRDFANYLGDRHPLRVIFVGHNPSDVSWDSIAPYAHATNKFWRLLREANLAPEKLCKPKYFSSLPAAAGIGFIDLFVTSGSDASKVEPGAEKLSEWREQFLERLENGTGGNPPKILCCISKIVAKKLLQGWNGDYGSVGKGSEWGLTSALESDIWVLPSTSGRAGLKWNQRLEPFQRLRAQFTEEWEE